MATLFYDSFQNTNNWVGGNGQSPTITVVSDPKGQYQKAVNFGASRSRPDSFSSVITNSYKSFTLNFDYLGVSTLGSNLGCIISVADGGSTSSATIAYAGAIKNSQPPIVGDHLSDSTSDCCGARLYYIRNSFIFLADNNNWNHYSISFTTNDQNIRIAISDFYYANYPYVPNSGDCYFANLLITDSYGPSPFIATSNPENFRSISVNSLNQVADTVSYINSNAPVNVNIGAKTASGGYANGDVLNDIINIIGSNYDDILLGGDGDNTLNGGGGNDTLTAGKGNDTLIGANGNDKFIVSTDINKATISDFSITDDIIDLRFFNNFYNLQSIISASSYTNGNTVINLGNGKTLTLNGINYNDLKESNFALTTSSPTSKPSFLPTFQPTFSPTFQPTFSPTLQPTLTPSSQPTFSPTLQPTSPTLIPTFTPSAAPSIAPSINPTASPSVVPTYFPTISAKPTLMPTLSPTAHPTSKDGYHEINIDNSSSDTYFGTEVADKFSVSAPGTYTITGGAGTDYYVIFNNLDSTLIINDFDVSAPEKIDLIDFPDLHSIKDLYPSSSGGYAIYKLQDSQEIKLKGITLGSITNDNFVFLQAENTLGSSDTNYDYSSMIIGLSAGLGAVFLGLCYVTYAAIYHRYPFSNHYNVSPQNEIEDNCEQHVKSLTPSAPPIMVEASLVSTSSHIELTGGNSNVLGNDN